MKRYHLRKTIVTRLQGLALILLAAAAHRTRADGAAILFALIGATMLCSNIHYYIYKAARKIVKYGNREEWYLNK